MIPGYDIYLSRTMVLEKYKHLLHWDATFFHMKHEFAKAVIIKLA